MSKKVVKVTCIVLAVIVALFLALTFGAGAYMVKYALNPNIERDVEVLKGKELDRYPGLYEWYQNLEETGAMKDTCMVDDEGYTIHAFYCEAEENVGKTAMILHGYTSNPLSMMMIARMYRDSLGYNVFLPHHNYHCQSEGDAVQMGWKDRLDVEQWIPVAHEVFGDTLQVVHGISMGGATTMMVSGDELPEYVRGFVDDCGYSSVWDQFSKELKGQFGLPDFPILYGADLVCRMKYGWGFKEASSVNQLAKCDKPMLFIHGDNDGYVPTAHVYVNYDAKVNGYKDKWLAPDTDHANSYRNHPAEYTARVREFLTHVE